MKRLLVLLSLLWVCQAGAETDSTGSPAYRKWKTECSGCHVAFPPQMLSSENWQELMDKLDKHFGSNATLDSKDRRQIVDFLKRYGGSGPQYTSATLRISETLWYKREHRVISEEEWKRPDVKTRANCGACHGKKVLGD